MGASNSVPKDSPAEDLASAISDKSSPETPSPTRDTPKDLTGSGHGDEKSESSTVTLISGAPSGSEASSPRGQASVTPSSSADDEGDALQLAEIRADSAVSQQFVDEITGVESTSEESQAEPQIVSPNEVGGNLLSGAVACNVPSNPNLTHWLSAEDWDERKHWFHQGDLVEFTRPVTLYGRVSYSHWGIYMGNGLVAHVTMRDLHNGSGSLFRMFTTAIAFAPSAARHPSVVTATTLATMYITLGDMVLRASPPIEEVGEPNQYYCRVDPIAAVACGQQFRVNNLVHRAKDHVVRKWEEIFQLVHSRVNQVHRYCMRTNNCEHVATMFRYRPKDKVPRQAKLSDE
ncbi:hypothetical protein BV898_10275 [Hypsibius exemplaris]|uniref:LRAT domain-containing protein n=1 Tax=Hypsibius exemplaris TaxID=2072580 RepID=A0A1W0WK21_HYPEX|nr:hypothetical protein BV898_10275 [Hypsibius exemplaris]